MVAAWALGTAALVSTAGVASAAPRLPTIPVGAAHFTVNLSGGAPGRIFYTTGIAAAVPIPAAVDTAIGRPQEAIIADKSGHVLWHYSPPRGQGIADFRTQTYRGQRVLTWWQGSGHGGHGTGVDEIADIHGRVIATVTPGGGLMSDVHEFRLLPDGRALLTAYVPVTADLTSVGGPRHGTMLDCVATVVDVASGRPLFRWSALRHIPVSATAQRYTGLLGAATFDPYHMNSIDTDPAGNLVISFRNLNAVYDVDIHTGAVRWRLGGKHSDFRMGVGAGFLGQHDVEFADATTLRMFDDNIDVTAQQGDSSIKWIRLDSRTHTARLVRAFYHPAGLATAAMGNAQALPGGDTFGSWGTSPHVSEFAPDGRMTYDATLPVGTYRAFLDAWP